MFFCKRRLRSGTQFFIILIILTLIFSCTLVVMAQQPVGKLDELSLQVSPAPALPEEPVEPIQPIKDTPILFPSLFYIVDYDIDSSAEYLNKILKSIGQLEVALASNEYSMYACEAMSQELSRLKAVAVKIESDIEQYRTWEEEHYYAAKVWLYFKQRGYNDAVVCAIIGNMMIETSGGSLDLKPNVYSPDRSHYGLCQWSLYYRPDIADLPFEYQLEYLEADMPDEFKTFGKCYKKGFTYEDFLTMTDPGSDIEALRLQ